MQQDNDPKHTSKLCSNYLHRKEKSGELKMMVWPPQSPDLNPTKLLWDELDRSESLFHFSRAPLGDPRERME